MDELIITFQGVCTSVFDIVPGVRMRTVLPNALAIRFGAIGIPTGPDRPPREVTYYTMPHIPLMRDRLVNGQHLWLTGQHLKVVNATPQPFHREPGGYSLGQFKKDVRLSSSVVFEGNAAAYFDVDCGRVWYDGGVDEPVTTHVSIKTDGKPRLSISPLPGSLPGSIDRHEIVQTIDTGELYVTNLDIQASVEDTQFDFLLNYLVTEGGIPKALTERTPGMTREARSMTLVHLGERLKALGLVIETGGTVKGWRDAQGLGDEPGFPQKVDPRDEGDDLGTLAKLTIDPVGLDPSCSPTNYP